MVVRQREPAEADLVFAAMADPTRRDIVARVSTREQSVSALAAGYPMTFAAVQRHVAVLERAGLVTKHQHGRERLVRVEVETLRAAARLLDDYEQLWLARIARIESLLSEVHPPQEN